MPDIGPEIENLDHFLGTWQEEDISFLFFSSPSDDFVSAMIDTHDSIQLMDTYQMTGEAWHGDRIEPYAIDSLYIYPPWMKPSGLGKSHRPVIMDPGVVFGTGRHQTTEDCLCLIHRLCIKEDIDSVLDIGTGTGLLSLGAAAMGCQKILACDFNRLAVKTTLNNIRLNDFEDRILAFQARGEQMMDIPCDLLVANIHYDVMHQMIRQKGLLKSKWFILSGLLISEARKVTDFLKGKPVHIVETRCPDGIWNTILCRSLI